MTDETPPDPATAGKDLAPPESIDEEDDTEPMTDDNPTKIAQAVNGFAQMDARQQTIHVWSVTSWRNGENTRHEVNLHEGTCTCEDMAYNQEEENQVCDHIMKANHVATQQMDISTALIHDLHNRMSRLEGTADRLEQAKTEYHAKMADADSGTAQSPEEAVGQASPEPEVDPDLAAEKLKDAFGEFVEDMQVKVDGGYLWIQTGKDTPEDFPAPGGMTTFEVLLQNPDQVEFIHDNHDAVSDKPGEWWKNRMNPSDVEEYINEVLN